jgi:hypothetical protein
MMPVSVHVQSRFTQDCRPGAFSAVPAGLVVVGMYTQDSRPGLFSAVPPGLIAIRLDSGSVFSECCPDQLIEKANLCKYVRSSARESGVCLPREQPGDGATLTDKIG